jgi:glycine/D-amino acid oxidase-like deaminating enzyme
MGHFYISQSDKGGLVFGGDLDFYASYAARGNLPMAEHVMEAGMTLMPMIGKARCCAPGAGSWTCRPTARRSSTAPHRRALSQLRLVLWRLQGGAGLGLFFAHLMATDRPHEVAAARYRLDRFATGRGLMDEEGTGSQHNLH